MMNQILMEYVLSKHDYIPQIIILNKLYKLTNFSLFFFCLENNVRNFYQLNKYKRLC